MPPTRTRKSMNFNHKPRSFTNLLQQEESVRIGAAQRPQKRRPVRGGATKAAQDLSRAAAAASSCRGEQRMCSTPGHGQNQGRSSLHSLHADVESVQGLGFESGLRQGLGVNRRVLLWQKDGVESGPARRQQKYPTRQQLQPRRHTRIEGHGGA